MEKEINNNYDIFHINMKINNYNGTNPKNIKWSKNIFNNNNIYGNIINNVINFQDRDNQLNINIKTDGNNFDEEAPNKLNDNYLHNRRFREESKREE